MIFGDRTTLHPDQLERYVRAGYVVVAADYRLAPEVKLEAIMEDVRDAYDWVRESGPRLFQVDPERIAVIGHSAGGYLALMTGFSMQPRQPSLGRGWCVCGAPPDRAPGCGVRVGGQPRPRALVSFYGYGDIASEWYSRPDPFYSQQPVVSEEEAHQAVGGPVITGTPFEGAFFEARYRFYLYCRQQGLWPREVGGHDPATEPAWFDSFCPLRNVTERYPPTLLIHGDQDTDVPFQQSVLMSLELERCGVEHELICVWNRGHVFDLEGEGMSDPAISELFDRVLAFLSK